MNILDNNAPAVEPVTLDQARTHLKLDVIDGENPDDALVVDLIVAAREHVENATQLIVASRTLTVFFDRFTDGEMELGVWPVTAVNSVIYEAYPNGYMTVPAAGYRLDESSKPAKLLNNMPWPQTTGRSGSVAVQVVAGFGSVPKAIKQAMLLLIGHWYENREAVNIGNSTSELPKAVDSLLDPHRIRQGV